MKNLMKTSIAMMAISISGCATPPAHAKPQQGRVIEFKSGPEGFDTRTFFYEGENEVVAFDAQFTPGLAEQSIRHLRTFTQKPITWLVITHPNPDKFNGASVFKKEGARIISSSATAEAIPGVHAYKEYYFVELAKMFRKGEYPLPVAVDQTFRGQMDLVLRGGERIQLRELSRPGVSSTQTVAYIRSVNTLMVGDLIHHKAHAWLEGGIVQGKPVPTLSAWVQDLKELVSIYPAEARVQGGRGVEGPLQSTALEQIRYLQTADRLVSEYITSLGARRDELKGEKAGEHYKDLQVRFERAFPDYGLGYMIQYGVYGLVNSKL